MCATDSVSSGAKGSMAFAYSCAAHSSDWCEDCDRRAQAKGSGNGVPQRADDAGARQIARVLSSLPITSTTGTMRLRLRMPRPAGADMQCRRRAWSPAGRIRSLTWP